jgi:TIR domain
MRPGIFISHSSRDDQFAATLRERLIGALRQQGADAWLDERRLGPGDRWRHEIYRGLVNCYGAVLLLSPAALESPWVRKEATILSFRGALRDRLRVVPVLLGGVTRADVEAAFPALYLSELETFTPTSDDAEATAQSIAALFDGLNTDSSDDMALWTRRIRGMLGRADEYVLDQAIAHLLDDGGEPDFADRAELMAHVLLHGTGAGVYPALMELNGQGPDLRALVGQVTPAFIEEQIAAPVRKALRATPAGLVAINAKSPSTGAFFARRASCSSTRAMVVEVAVVGTELTVESVAAATRSAAAQRFRRPQPPSREWLAEQKLLLVIVLSVESVPGSTLEKILTVLREEWRTSVFVVLTGRLTPDGGPAIAPLAVDLPAGYEEWLTENAETLEALPSTI